MLFLVETKPPPTQWNLKGMADELMLNKVEKKKQKLAVKTEKAHV
jgi:hypothetical protein